MTTKELDKILSDALQLKAENEIIEFKEAKSNYDFAEIGQYFSALSNEANLKNSPYAWLIFGVKNKTHEIVGSHYRKERHGLDKLKRELATNLTGNISFIEIYELHKPEGRVVMFQIPASPQGIPIAYNGHFYSRSNESLVGLNIEKIERIRNQVQNKDWTREIIPDAGIDDLDTDAIEKAKIQFVNRNPKYADEIKDWNTAKFLDKAKLTLNGKITRACFILLGKDNKEHYLDSAVKIRWNLKTVDNQDKDYEIFSIPFILTVDEVFAKIRNLKYRYLPDGTLFPLEYLRYEPFVIRESVHNCIAHQDYSKKARINVVEFEDEYLVFSNYGSFLPKSVEDVVLKDTPEELYRNPFLVEAMRNLDMIETQGGGLRKIFNFQKNRYFPMPEFDFSDGKVKFTITGKIINQNYARILHKNLNLKFDEVLILDKVQKHIKLTKEELRFCRNNNFVIGHNRKIELFVEDENDSNNEFGINDGIKFGVNDKKFGIKFGVKFGVNQEKILSLIEKTPNITANEIANKLGITERAVEKNLAKLKEMNVIERIGSDKTGEWKISETV